MFMLNKTILNILSNFIPHETVNDKDPPWFTKKNKNLIQEKNNVYKSYRNSKNNNIQYLRRLKLLQEDLHNDIEVLKSIYYSKVQKLIGHY